MDLVKQSISGMALMPPHCPISPHSYSSFFNGSQELLGGVAAPYRYELRNENHPRNGSLIQKLEYNNFYSDWKQDAVKWYPSGSKEFTSMDEEQNGNIGYHPLQDKANKSLELYEHTRRRDSFAFPLPTNGTNQIRILFNDKCNVPTFKYNRYASQSLNNSSWFNNKLYKEDISEETQEQKEQYMNSLIQNGMDLYSSVFEDMYIMQSNPSSSDNLNYIRKAY